MNSSDTKSLLLEIFDLVTYIIFVAGIVFFIRFFIINPFNVVGSSMFPTLHDGDFIMVDKITPRFGEFQRGDIIVFVPMGKKDPYVKTIIGMPGETVTLDDDKNTVQICQPSSGCFLLDQSKILPAGSQTLTVGDKKVFTLTKGYFVMGDNRGGSTDSRACFGYQCYTNSNYEVTKEYILGKVLLRLFPSPQFFSTHTL